jgi:four helix bundle protein
VPYEPLEDKRMYRRAEAIADSVWEVVAGWDWFVKRTVGSQLVRAVGSIGANIAEAGGRFHPLDVKKFLYYSRGSLRETKYWLRRAAARNLVNPDFVAPLDRELEQLAREINAAISFQKSRAAAPHE